MDKVYHILNGDSLKERFPKAISGNVLVCRECLVDGPTTSETLEDFYKVRAHFIAENYPGFSEAEYHAMTVPEIEKIRAIPKGAEVNLWFEDDLFCQVNFWFTGSLLEAKKVKLFLVRPVAHTPYGFAAYDTKGLQLLFEQKEEISNASKQGIIFLWKWYQRNDLSALSDKAKELAATFPFIQQAIAAHVERIPTEASLGRPKESLRKIMQEFNTKEFPKVFKEFSKRETIYGFGDVQVKRLFDEVIQQNDLKK